MLMRSLLDLPARPVIHPLCSRSLSSHLTMKSESVSSPFLSFFSTNHIPNFHPKTCPPRPAPPPLHSPTPAPASAALTPRHQNRRGPRTPPCDGPPTR